MGTHFGNNATIIPKLQAIPLPPLNFIKNGKSCPKIAPMAPYNCNRAICSGCDLWNNSQTTTTAATHFRQSNRRVNAPALIPRIRIVLVVPTLPLPCVRISTSFALPNRYPDKNKPKTYPIKSAMILVITISVILSLPDNELEWCSFKAKRITNPILKVSCV